MKRGIVCLSMVLALTTSAASGQTTRPENPPAVVNTAAPAFNLTALDGEKFELAALRGKIVVFNFWFTGCEPCVEEMPELNELVNLFKDKEVVFIAPTWDNPTVLQTFLKEHSFKYHVIPNSGGLILGPYTDGTKNVVFPTHLVIDREGKIDTRVTGVKHLDELRKAIERLVHRPSEVAK